MKAWIIILLFLILGFGILLHQYLYYGAWFEIKDIHHETFALTFFGMALGAYLGKKMEESE